MFLYREIENIKYRRRKIDVRMGRTETSCDYCNILDKQANAENCGPPRGNNFNLKVGQGQG